MSRVDQALRIAAGGPMPEPANRATLGDYPLESLTSVDLDGLETRGPSKRPVIEPPRIAFRPVAGRVVRSRADVEFEGKLVASEGTTVVPLEQYRRLAAALHDAQAESGLKTVMVTSALPREGKTLTVVNLALTLSESYARRVLLIDADLRRPSIHSVLGLPGDGGLSEVLQGEQLELPLVQLSPLLSVLPAGVPGPNPLSGLTSERMEALLAECASQFEWVLLDTPPVGLLPDARLLARLTRAVLFVISAGTTPAAVVERSIAELGPDWVLGTVLNRIEDRAIPDSGYYEYEQAASSSRA